MAENNTFTAVARLKDLMSKKFQQMQKNAGASFDGMSRKARKMENKNNEKKAEPTWQEKYELEEELREASPEEARDLLLDYSYEMIHFSVKERVKVTLKERLEQYSGDSVKILELDQIISEHLGLIGV